VALTKEACDTFKQLERQLEETNNLLHTEQPTYSMLQHMHTRVYDEIGDIRKISEGSIVALEKNKAESRS
jgi:hypothetical protein